MKEVLAGAGGLSMPAEQFAGAHLSLRMRAARAGLAVLTAVSFASCHDGSEDSQTYAEPAAAVRVESGFGQAPELPEGWPACKPSDDPRLERLAAKQCLDVMQNGSAAVITFGVDTQRAEEIAEMAEQTMEEATDGRVQISLEVVPATQQAAEAVEAILTEESCVESGNLTAVVVDEAMPELQRHDFVMSMPDFYSCEGQHIAGLAYKNRYADIYMPASKTDSQSADVFNHELGHALGAGHTGSALVQLSNGGFSGIRIDIGSAVDLNAFLKHADYNEYTSTSDDIMGPADLFPNLSLNEIHLGGLYWPEEVLYGHKVSLEVGEVPVTFTLEDAQAGRFGRVRLDQPLTLQTEKDGEPVEVVFDNVVVVPNHNKFQPSQGVTGADIFIENSQNNNVVALGTVGNATQAAEWTIASGETSVVISIDDTRNMQMRTLSESGHLSSQFE